MTDIEATELIAALDRVAESLSVPMGIAENADDADLRQLIEKLSTHTTAMINHEIRPHIYKRLAAQAS